MNLQRNTMQLLFNPSTLRLFMFNLLSNSITYQTPSLSIHHYPSINIHPSLSIHQYPSINIHHYPSLCVTIHASLSICLNPTLNVVSVHTEHPTVSYSLNELAELFFPDCSHGDTQLVSQEGHIQPTLAVQILSNFNSLEQQFFSLLVCTLEVFDFPKSLIVLTFVVAEELWLSYVSQPLHCRIIVPQLVVQSEQSQRHFDSISSGLGQPSLTKNNSLKNISLSQECIYICDCYLRANWLSCSRDHFPQDINYLSIPLLRHETFHSFRDQLVPLALLLLSTGPIIIQKSAFFRLQDSLSVCVEMHLHVGSGSSKTKSPPQLSGQLRGLKLPYPIQHFLVLLAVEKETDVQHIDVVHVGTRTRLSFGSCYVLSAVLHGAQLVSELCVEIQHVQLMLCEAIIPKFVWMCVRMMPIPIGAPEDFLTLFQLVPALVDFPCREVFECGFFVGLQSLGGQDLGGQQLLRLPSLRRHLQVFLRKLPAANALFRPDASEGVGDQGQDVSGIVVHAQRLLQAVLVGLQG